MRYDVIGIGRAFMDVIAYVPDEFLRKYNLKKGQGNELKVETLREIKNLLPDAQLIPGGAAANTIAGISSLGGKAGFIGKACSDNMGKIFREYYDNNNVDFPIKEFTPFPEINRATGRCLVLVTPDIDRTFAFTLGVCEDLSPADIDENFIKQAKILFIEGQMLVSQTARSAVKTAITFAKQHNVKVAFNMHDLNFGEERVKEIIGIIRSTADILIGNRHEIRNCFEIGEDEDIEKAISHDHQTLAVTKGSKGATILHKGQSWDIPSVNKDKVMDSTGAGDQFAAGFLYGYAKGLPMDVCGLLGATSAAEVLKHWGGRPEVKLADLVGNLIAA